MTLGRDDVRIFPMTQRAGCPVNSSGGRFSGIGWTRAGLIAVLLISLWLRLVGIDWDGLYHLHPDERYIVWVGTTIEFPSDWESAFDPEQSTFNPFHWPPEAASKGILVERGEPRSFAYGHWPLYLGVAATRLMEKGTGWAASLPETWTLARDLFNVAGRIEYQHLLLVGRGLAALFDTLTVLLVYQMGRRLYGAAAGLVGALLVALAVLHIQQAHFFVTDPFLTTAVTASINGMVRRAQSRRWLDGLAAGALVGLAVGAKFSAIMLILPLTVSLIWGRQVPPLPRGSGLRRWLGRRWRWLRRPALELAAALAIGFLVFFLTNPFAILDRTCEETVGGYEIPLIQKSLPQITVHSCYLENIGTQSAMVRGGSRIPFTYQYIGTPAYLYYLDQMLRWGLGAPLTLLGFGGLLWAIWRVVRRRPALIPGEAVLLAWALPFFMVTGSFQVKFLRYLLPLTPVLAVYAAGMLIPAWREVKGAMSWRRLVMGGSVLLTAIYAVSFVGLYREVHPLLAASRWLFQNAPRGSVIATEHWDYALPVRLREAEFKGLPGAYESVILPWFDVEDRLGRESSQVPLATAVERLAGSDFLVLASNRLYGVIPRLPERYPEVSAYYHLLFSGELGFELVYWADRYPALGPWVIKDDTFGRPGLPAPAELRNALELRPVLRLGPADESFTVYDHPLVLIFENQGQMSPAAIEALIRGTAGSD